MYDFLLVRHCNYSSLSCTICELFDVEYIVTFKPGLEVTQYYWNWCH